MIVKNEQEFLEKCLESVKEIADEIIIIDTGSKDKTLDIAKKFNAKIFKTKWEDDFSKARNLSLEKATGDWILVLDADETISKKDLSRIKELIAKAPDEILGFMLIQRSYIDNSKFPKWVSSERDAYEESKPYSGWIYSGITRIFRNKPEIRFEYPVHETVKESIKRANGKIAVANIPIHHYGKIRDGDIVNKKSELYLELGKKKLKENPNGKFYYELGIQAQVLGKDDEAEECFKKAIELKPELSGPYINLGSLYSRQKKFQKALDIMKKALPIAENNSDLHNNLGIAYEKLNDKKSAFESYKKSITLNPRNTEALINVSRILFQAGEHEAVKKLLSRVLQLNPKEYHAHNVIGVICQLAGDIDDSIEHFKKSIEIRENPEAMMNLGYAYITQKKNKEAKNIFENLLKMNYSIEEVKKVLDRI